MLNNIRIEEDLLGTREVPADAYYGVHTLRAIENFYISNSKISDIPEFRARHGDGEESRRAGEQGAADHSQKRGKCDYRRL